MTPPAANWALDTLRTCWTAEEVCEDAWPVVPRMLWKRVLGFWSCFHRFWKYDWKVDAGLRR